MVAENLERHLRHDQAWHPHDYVPWSRGRDFAFLGGEDWRPEDSPLDPVAQTAMTVNLLTEDNLPSYHREIATRFGRDGAWGEWVGRWTAEEGRHGIALRDYLVVTRGVDPVELENLRMAHMSAGYDSGDKTALQAVAYVSFQELATRVSHRNTGAATGCPLAEQLLARIAADENLHMVFYRNLVAAALDRAPDATMCAIRDEVVGFQMPGAGHARLRPQLGHDRQGRDLRPAPAPRRRHRARAAVLEDLQPRRLRPRGRAGPRRAGATFMTGLRPAGRPGSSSKRDRQRERARRAERRLDRYWRQAFLRRCRSQISSTTSSAGAEAEEQRALPVVVRRGHHQHQDDRDDPAADARPRGPTRRASPSRSGCSSGWSCL